MSDKIQRYIIREDGEEAPYADGEFVFHNDHAAAMAEKDAEIARLKERVDVAERDTAWVYGIHIPEVAEAARREALEEAAKTCDKMQEMAEGYERESSHGIARSYRREANAFMMCASSIRALIDAPSTGKAGE